MEKTDFVNRLPNDMILVIMMELDSVSLVRFRKCCKRLYNISKNDYLWKNIAIGLKLQIDKDYYDAVMAYYKMCHGCYFGRGKKIRGNVCEIKEHNIFHGMCFFSLPIGSKCGTCELMPVCRFVENHCSYCREYLDKKYGNVFMEFECRLKCKYIFCSKCFHYCKKKIFIKDHLTICYKINKF